MIAQTSTEITFSMLMGGHPMVVNENSEILFKSDSLNLEINELKFYISQIQFLRDNQIVFAEENSFHLIDAALPVTQKINITHPESLVCDQLKFCIGIDSVTNVSGALGGDLDPTKGMYWAWQSGYINFKMEGKNNNKEFSLHIGGYKQPYYCIQSLSFPIDHLISIPITFDIKRFMDKVEKENKMQIMSPCKEAVVLSKEMVNCFNLNSK